MAQRFDESAFFVLAFVAFIAILFLIPVANPDWAIAGQ
jgi:hypothetical protein